MRRSPTSSTASGCDRWDRRGAAPDQDSPVSAAELMDWLSIALAAVFLSPPAVAPLTVAPKHDRMIESDNGVRAEQTIEALARLRPVFDRREGDVTESRRRSPRSP